MKIGIVDTGVNPWHSHVRGRITGCRIFLGPDGTLGEDADFRDPVGHGTAVAGVIREALPDAVIFAVRVFDAHNTTYPSLVARGILRAAAEQCDFVNISVALPPGPGHDVVAMACASAIESGCVLVAPARADQPGWLPAALPGVYAVSADDSLAFGAVRTVGPMRLAASGRPRGLGGLAPDANLRGPSFACAHGLVHLVRRRATLECGYSIGSTQWIRSTPKS
jgi:subtilisin family serine protease